MKTARLNGQNDKKKQAPFGVPSLLGEISQDSIVSVRLSRAGCPLLLWVERED